MTSRNRAAKAARSRNSRADCNVSLPLRGTCAASFDRRAARRGSFRLCGGARLRPSPEPACATSTATAARTCGIAAWVCDAKLAAPKSQWKKAGASLGARRLDA